LVAGQTYNVRTYHANPRNGTTPFVQGAFQVYTNDSPAAKFSVTSIAAGATAIGIFTATADANGVLLLDFRSTGSFLISGVEISVGALNVGNEIPLLAAGDPSDGGAPTISLDMLQPVVTEATARWSDTGLTPAQAATLSNVQFAVADLGGAYLGLANPATNQIRIDDDAARLGWAAGPSAGGVDLLTVVMHEMGHLLGSDHSDDDHDLMAPVLSASPLRAYSFDLRPSSAKRAEAVEPLGQAEWRTGLTPFMFGPSSRASGRSSGVHDVFAQLDRESASLDGESETVSTWLQSAADGLWAARATRSGEETTQARVPRRSRMPRFERELDAWFAELAAEESGQ
jgi:hypothetical protein